MHSIKLISMYQLQWYIFFKTKLIMKNKKIKPYDQCPKFDDNLFLEKENKIKC